MKHPHPKGDKTMVRRQALLLLAAALFGRPVVENKPGAGPAL